MTATTDLDMLRYALPMPRRSADLEREIRETLVSAGDRLDRRETLTRRERRTLADYERGRQDGFEGALRQQTTGRSSSPPSRRSSASLPYQIGYRETAREVRDGVVASPAPPVRRLPVSVARRGWLARLLRGQRR